MKREKGYSYSYSEEKIEKFRKLSPQEKLEWLEQIMTFLSDFMPQRNKAIYEKLRKGEI